MIYLAREHLRKSVTCDDATWLDLKSEYDLSAMLRALASKGGSSLFSLPNALELLLRFPKMLFCKHLAPMGAVHRGRNHTGMMGTESFKIYKIVAKL